MNSLRQLLPVDAWNRGVFAIFLGLWAVSCVRVPYPKYFWLQHVPTVAVVVILAVMQNRLSISRSSYTLVLSFMALHVLGARYLYSYVPYDEWSEQFAGFRITDHFGFTRNHYDRLVHFFYGAMLVIPGCRFLRRITGTHGGWAALFAFSIIMASSAVYEVFEWLVAATMAPDWAESYNGQQGDPWDAQRDMALAAAGAIVSLVIAAGWHWRIAADKTTLRSP
jgi:putative membrane protein